MSQKGENCKQEIMSKAKGEKKKMEGGLGVWRGVANAKNATALKSL